MRRAKVFFASDKPKSILIIPCNWSSGTSMNQTSANKMDFIWNKRSLSFQFLFYLLNIQYKSFQSLTSSIVGDHIEIVLTKIGYFILHANTNLKKKV